MRSTSLPKSTDIRLLSVSSESEQIVYRAPIKFGGRVVTAATLLHVTAEVETRDGRRGQGIGSMPMGNVWAWPTRDTPVDDTLAAMVWLCERLVRDANAYRDRGHPLVITL